MFDPTPRVKFLQPQAVRGTKSVSKLKKTKTRGQKQLRAPSQLHLALSCFSKVLRE